MAKIFRVNSQHEALELAIKLKKSKKYNLFRGQNEDWPLVASINRLSTRKRKDAAKRLWTFRLFLSEYKLTETITENLDLVMAIAQHYGIPTDFIDFTQSPEIAMFFATHSKKDLRNKEGVILCLNKTDFEQSIKYFDALFSEKELIPPYIYDADIDNLWRLHAQYGCFLQLSFGGLENLYAFDKIIFPHTNEKPINICISDVYPENKSDLEIILDNYFAAERIDKGAKRLKKFADEMGIPISKIPNQKTYEYVKSRKTHKSWSCQKTNIWKYDMSESFSRIKDFEFSLYFKSSGDFCQDVHNIEKLLSSIFSKNRITKQHKINPLIHFTPKIRSKNLSLLINRNVKRIWDGMCTLPYTRKQIIYSISKYLALEFYESIKKINTEKLFQNPILIEMSDLFGAHCRCYVSKLLLQEAIRDDILDIQDESLPKSISTDPLFYI